MASRKYRQRGYMEDDSKSSTRRSGGPRPKREGPRGRGLGRPTETVFRCAQCGEKRVSLDPVDLEETCARCGTDLHTCTHCRHFDTSAPKECRKPVAERVAKKSDRNSCSEFEPKLAQEFDKDAGPPDDPRAAFDALFKI